MVLMMMMIINRGVMMMIMIITIMMIDDIGYWFPIDDHDCDRYSPLHDTYLVS
jgi:hypothetical protein